MAADPLPRAVVAAAAAADAPVADGETGRSDRGTIVRLVLEHVCLAGIAIAFCIVMFDHALSVAQRNDHESAWTMTEAVAVANGTANWGMLEYTHHPIGRAYLLVPLAWAGNPHFPVVPIAVAALTTALALLLLLQRASTVMMRGFLVAFFLVLLWQPGFGEWIGNLHQHSYNMSSILLLVVLCGGLRRAAWPLAATGAVCGWIGYDFFVVQILSILALRIAYWMRRDGTSFAYAVWAAGSEAAAFAAAFLTSVLLHYGQNVLYFHSAEMAYEDIYGSFDFRVGATVGERPGKMLGLLALYVGRFFAAEWSWSTPALLLGIAGLYLVATVHGALWWARDAYRAGAPPASITRLSLAFAASAALALASVPAWLFIAPRHAEPHVHLFPRLFFVPMIVLVACTVLVLSRRDRDAVARRWGARAVPIALFAAVVGLNLFGPAGTKAALDQRFFDTIWNSTSAAVRTDKIAAPLLAASPSASSVGAAAALAAPLTLKDTTPLIAGLGVWGIELDAGPGLRWFPDAAQPFPHFYEQRFAAPAQVTDVALRFWGEPMRFGAHTPDRFELIALAADRTAAPVLSYPGPFGQVTRQGKYLAIHYQFSPPLECQGLRIEIGSTVGHKEPVMTDFLAFGFAADPDRR